MTTEYTYLLFSPFFSLFIYWFLFVTIFIYIFLQETKVRSIYKNVINIFR